MIPAAFDFIRAGSVDEAIAALAEHGDEAKLIAGGHSLIPLMRFRLAAPPSSSTSIDSRTSSTSAMQATTWPSAP